MPIYKVTNRTGDRLLSPRERTGRLRGKGKRTREPRPGYKACWVEAIDGRDAICWLLRVPYKGTEWWNTRGNVGSPLAAPTWSDLSTRETPSTEELDKFDYAVSWVEQNDQLRPSYATLAWTGRAKQEELITAEEYHYLAQPDCAEEVENGTRWPPVLDGTGPGWTDLDFCEQEYRRIVWQTAVRDNIPPKKIKEGLAGGLAEYRKARQDGKPPDSAFAVLYG